MVNLLWAGFGLVCMVAGALWARSPEAYARNRIAGLTGGDAEETPDPAGVRVAGVRLEGVTLFLMGLFAFWAAL